MEILAILIPVSIGMGGLGLLAFVWSLRNRQYEDPKGDAQRILSGEWDERPAPPREASRDDS
ncbi:MAG: cbb3-type cytochrome oxidase assembly protein CcoS [Paracoccus sp. (in: a-proteobacteria)]|uniref:cbb3-type cytochrome oxidase assembly protein CcoS n=1 Tax=Paracoccus sp. TaxID=267 RepID=UPI0026DEB823|nr:cbb3-type cytochrome oxidase assembly protein CcoS [Paracoccus sp. (in: a-proteobacteria)]MDO5620589.1 cbb3-type cytochrome oxidase assembly protein CcoS [Paracoccus sp. (in: a-proteobacteria)]